MHFLEGIRIALGSILSHKLRSFLVMLGNVIAVASIIAVVSIVDGMNVYMHEKVFEQGSGVVELMRVDEMQILTDMDAFMASISNPHLHMDDLEYLREQVPSALDIGAVRNARASVKAGSHSLRRISIRGRTADYPFLENVKLSAGRHFSRLEMQRSRQVAVIGSQVAEELFPGVDPVGKTIKIRRRPYTVIGVTESKGRILGENQDVFALIPLSTFLKTWGRYGWGRSLTIRARAASTSEVPLLTEEIRQAMRMRHRLGPGEDDDFALRDSGALLGLWEKIKNIMLSVLMMIVGVSAIVAGIVIMNIMLVSVQERTREIGIRKAIGARYGDILWQFLVEAVTLSTIGGLVGIFLGYALAAAIAEFSPLPYAAKAWSVLLGLVLTVSVGGLFGIFPARRAALLDPVEALRHG